LGTLSDCLTILTRLIEEVRHDEDYWLGRSDHKRY